MKIKNKEKKYLSDDIAVMILNDPKHKEYLASIIASTIHLDKQYVMDNLEYYNTRLYESIENKHTEADSIFEIPEGFINIELNYNHYLNGKIKNTIYALHLIIRQTKPNKDYKEIKKVWQINLNNYDYYHKKEFIYHTVLMETKYHVKREDILEIIDINLDFLYKLDYTEIRKLKSDDLEWLLYILVCRDEEIREQIYQENKMMERVDESMKELSGEFDKWLFYDHEEFKKKSAYIEGEMNGEKIGKNKATKKIAKAMLKETPEIAIETISKITGLTKREIESLREDKN